MEQGSHALLVPFRGAIPSGMSQVVVFIDSKFSLETLRSLISEFLRRHINGSMTANHEQGRKMVKWNYAAFLGMECWAKLSKETR